MRHVPISARLRIRLLAGSSIDVRHQRRLAHLPFDRAIERGPQEAAVQGAKDLPGIEGHTTESDVRLRDHRRTHGRGVGKSMVGHAKEKAPPKIRAITGLHYPGQCTITATNERHANHHQPRGARPSRGRCACHFDHQRPVHRVLWDRTEHVGAKALSDLPRPGTQRDHGGEADGRARFAVV